MDSSHRGGSGCDSNSREDRVERRGGGCGCVCEEELRSGSDVAMHMDTSKGACNPVGYPMGGSSAVDSDDARGGHAEGAGSVPSEHVSDRDRVSVCKKEGKEEGKRARKIKEPIMWRRKTEGRRRGRRKEKVKSRERKREREKENRRRGGARLLLAKERGNQVSKRAKGKVRERYRKRTTRIERDWIG